VSLRNRRLVAALAWLTCTAQFVPSDVRLSIDSPRRITVAAAGAIISSATLCPNYEFATLGAGGPTLSPDLHWILVDVKGPYEPASVPVTHALIWVTTGAIVMSPDFPAYVGVPNTLDPIAWASGLRSTLRYKNETLEPLRDPPPRSLPALDCNHAPPI
jgi:hypothetical protein